ncbi:MAG: sigma-70 family RNA polymerase sigma factor [Actinobacteria bacterium]|nr:sigma-70 family RNA polymerase sigma factor [Actinomycetota bacterium]
MDIGPWSVTDEESLVACYDQSVQHVYRYASRFTGNDRARTDDLVQEVYLGLVKAARGGLGEVGIGWLCTSVRHRFLDRVRGEQREVRRLRLIVSPTEEHTSDETVDVPGLAELPDRERAALVLRYLDDLSVPEVAATMDLTVHATESLLARARRRLRGQEVRDA